MMTVILRVDSADTAGRRVPAAAAGPLVRHPHRAAMTAPSVGRSRSEVIR